MRRTPFTFLCVLPLLLAFTVGIGFARSAEDGPPISQPLVREGDFAIELAQRLLLSTYDDETEAENALASAGIAPRNGWIADYPVTPDVLGEVQNEVSAAAEAGRLAVSRDEALRKIDEICAEMSLYVRTAPEAESRYGKPGQLPPSYSDQAALEEYYYDYGPPVISYYPPPVDYGYLYGWVPYPFWWSGFWFPGYWALRDFDVIITSPWWWYGGHHHHHGDYDGHHARVTNHVVDNQTGRATRIDPATRRTIGGRPGSVNNVRRSQGFADTRARSGAGRIVERSASSGLTGTKPNISSRNATGTRPNIASNPISNPRQNMSGATGRRLNGNSFGTGSRALNTAPSPRGRTGIGNYQGRYYSPYTAGRIQGLTPSIGGRSIGPSARGYAGPSGGARIGGSAPGTGFSRGGGSPGGGGFLRGSSPGGGGGGRRH